LPDRTFGASVIEAALLIANDPRPPAPAVITVRSTEIADRDRSAFLKTGKTTTQRQLVRPVSENPTGELWIPPLAALWQYLDAYPRLKTKLQPSRGLEWTYDQTEAFSEQPQPGFRKGLHSARRFRQFVLGHWVWLDYRQEFVRRGYNRDWDRPKLITNAGRLSRGPWRIGAALDTERLLYSQQFFGLWPKTSLPDKDLLALSAVVNGPVANAFIAIHSPANRIRASGIEQIPIPLSLSNGLPDLVAEYAALLANLQALRDNDERLAALLTQIDAVVLEAYDLPPRLERQLLEYFRDAERPVAHAWAHWDVIDPTPGLRLAERVSGRFRPNGDWIAEVFRPLPEREAALLRELGE
jgi:hypothetical protein